MKRAAAAAFKNTKMILNNILSEKRAGNYSADKIIGSNPGMQDVGKVCVTKAFPKRYHSEKYDIIIQLHI